MREPENIELIWEGDILLIRIDTSRAIGWSKSGKSIIIASSYGTLSENGISLNFSAYRKPQPGERPALMELFPDIKG